VADVKATPAQQAELDDLNAQFDALLERHQGHPIIKTALQLCTTDDGKPWRDQLHPDAIKYLQDLLAECDQDGTIGWATHGLIAVANYLDSKQAGRVAYDILNLANDTVIKYDLVKRQEDAKKAWAKRSDQKRKDGLTATGGAANATAPKLGEKAPAGTVKGGTLGPKRRV
jgi:hypothetical protein